MLPSSERYTVTRLQSFLTCPARYHYSTELRIPSPASGPMLSGTAIHAGLEAKYMGLDQDAIVGRILGSLGANTKFAQGAVKAVGSCTKPVTDQIIQEVSMELVLDVDGSQVRLTGKPDLIEVLGGDTSDPWGILITEFKSTSKSPKKALEGYNLSQQVWLYATMVEQHFQMPVYVQYWVLGTQGQEEAAGDLMLLTPARRETAISWASNVIRLMRTGARPMNPSGLCDWCPFQDLDWIRAQGGDWQAAAEDMKLPDIEETEDATV